MENKMYQRGIAKFNFEDRSRIFNDTARSLDVSVWYPVEKLHQTQKQEAGIWKVQDAAEGAPISQDKKFPLIMFSHGYSGNQWTNTWFAEFLVPHGYIVAYVKHYGNSSENMIPEICVRPWNRPQDMRFVLDHLLKDPLFKESIDMDRIGVAGFSQGGATSLWLAGIQASLSPENLRQQITFINDPESQKTYFKNIPQERMNSILDKFTSQDFDQANQSYRDERIKAAFAMAPALDEKNIMFTPEGISQVKIPTHILIGQADNDFIDQSKFFHQHIAHSLLTIIPGAVSHMTLLNEGTRDAKLFYPEYTVDDPSINRAEVHKHVGTRALKFFNQHFNEALR